MCKVLCTVTLPSHLTTSGHSLVDITERRKLKIINLYQSPTARAHQISLISVHPFSGHEIRTSARQISDYAKLG
jgi:hypothetical protein